MSTYESTPDGRSRPLYDGRAALRLMYEEELRKAKGATSVVTLRALLGNALHDAEHGDAWAAAGSAKAAAEYARKLGRELTAVAKKMEDAAKLADEGFSTEFVLGGPE